MDIGKIITFVLLLIVILGIIIAFVVSSIWEKKRTPTYHFVEGDTTIVCVHVRIMRFSEYKMYKFRKDTDSKYRFLTAQWIRNTSLKILITAVIIAGIFFAYDYIKLGGIKHEDIPSYIVLMLFFSLIVFLYEYIPVLRAKFYLKKLQKVIT